MASTRILVTPHVSQTEIIQCYQTCSSDCIKIYWQVILLLSQSEPSLTIEEVAHTVHLSTDWVRNWCVAIII